METEIEILKGEKWSLFVFGIRILVQALFDERLDLVDWLEEQVLVANVQNDKYNDEYDAENDDHDDSKLNKDRIGLKLGMIMVFSVTVRSMVRGMWICGACACVAVDISSSRWRWGCWSVCIGSINFTYE